jgi:hypothetical protein
MIRRGAIAAMVLLASLAAGAEGQQVSAELTVRVSIPPMVRIDAATSPSARVNPVASVAHEAVFRITANSSWKVDLEVDPAAGCVVTAPEGVQVSGGSDSGQRRLEGRRGTHEPVQVTCARPGARPHARVVVARH